MDLSHVLWIGGGQRSGKSSIARALSRRFDLQLYAIDDHDRAHEPRMPAPGPGSPATPAELLERFVMTSRHRFRLVLEDLAALPASPLAIVEGMQLLPTSVAAVLREADHALFLVPGAGEQLTQRIAREAADLRLATLTVDAPLEEMIERAAAHFLPVISAAGDRSPLRRPTP
ncbi:MAG TPA: hypothetical protein VIL77_08620 [Gaiellaceae bacterium]